MDFRLHGSGQRLHDNRRVDCSGARLYVAFGLRRYGWTTPLRGRCCYCAPEDVARFIEASV